MLFDPCALAGAALVNNLVDNLLQSIASFGVDRGATDWKQAVRENPDDSRWP